MNTTSHNGPKRTALASSIYSRPSHYRENVKTGTGHAPGEDTASGNLRDSCADPATYPWRVVGYGDQTWAVEGHNGRTVHRGPDIDRAHAVARAFKVLHPEGHIDRLNAIGTPINISGPNHTIPVRVAGLLLEVTNIETGHKVRYLATQAQPSLHHVRVLDIDSNKTRDLKVTALANNPTLKVDLNIDQFLKVQPEESAQVEATA